MATCGSKNVLRTKILTPLESIFAENVVISSYGKPIEGR